MPHRLYPRPPRSAKRKPKPVEYNILLTATLCLLAAGAVMVYSASSARTLLEGQGDGTMYLVSTSSTPRSGSSCCRCSHTAGSGCCRS